MRVLLPASREVPKIHPTPDDLLRMRSGEDEKDPPVSAVSSFGVVELCNLKPDGAFVLEK
jgi:hypothetical protein